MGAFRPLWRVLVTEVPLDSARAHRTRFDICICKYASSTCGVCCCVKYSVAIAIRRIRYESRKGGRRDSREGKKLTYALGMAQVFIG
ncbi:hypothetical protein K438DRAFT_1828767 [Mycena galopus ATCC 62051]|nr:hypothetical protein K438DRAFT_1828767 [Mycena galopus ATCC 62051]